MSADEAGKLSRVEELRRTLRDIEHELATLTGGRPDLVAGEAGELAPRQLAEQQLAMLNALPAHIALVDEAGVILAVNEAWRRFAQANVLQGSSFGVGLNYLDLCDRPMGDCSEEGGAAADGIRRVLRGEISQFALEYPCHSPSERRWFRLMVTPLHEGQPGGAVIMHVDVSERRLAEERLRESLARSVEAERIAGVGSWVLTLHDLEDLTNNTLTISDELRRILNIEPGAQPPTVDEFARLLPAEALAELWEAARRAIRERRPYSLIQRLPQPDGTERVLHTIGRCFFDEQTGKPLELLGTMHDITEQAQADEALRRSEREQRLIARQLETERARLAMAQQVARVGSWETDLSTLEVVWSEQTFRIFEVDPETFKPSHSAFLECVHPEDRAAVDAAFVGSMRDSAPRYIEHRLLFPDGRTKFVEERWQAVLDEQGRPVRAVGTCQDITERKRADAELSRSRELLRIASSAARLGGWMIELPERSITISDELRAIHELPADAEPTLEELTELYEPEERAELRKHIDACLRDGTPYDVELPKFTATGRRFWLRSVGEAVRGADGQIIRLQGAGQDVTSRKLVERELSRVHRALRVFSSCNEALVRAQSEQELLDQVCRVAVEVGGYVLAWVGYADDDAAKTIGVRASAGVSPGFLDGLRLSWSADLPEGGGPAGKAVRTGELAACSDVTVDADFEPWRARAVANGIRSVHCFPLRQASRTLGVIALYGAEVSSAGPDELKLLHELADNLAFGITSLRAREANRRSEQKLREQAKLLDQTSEAIFVRDLDDRITYWNRGAERLYGWTAAEAIGRRAAELFHGTDAARLAQAQAARAHLLATGAWDGELDKCDKAGRSRLIAARWSLLRDPEGQPQAVLTLNADITEKRQFEMQLLRRQRLESIGTLAGGIAHDLNNVLAPILTSIAMLREAETNPDKLDDLATLESSAERGAAMVRQLLSFARGEPQGPHKSVDVIAIAGEASRMTRETFPKDITSVLRAVGSPPTVRGDATQIHQLITNLCVNARDAMPNGGLLSIELESTVIDELYAGMSADVRPGRYLRLRVEDTGSGMTPEVRDRIFEPFFTTKPSGTGTGLGLSMCHAIAKSHGGFILVSTELGRGSRFDVYLPAEDSTELHAEAKRAPAEPPGGLGELVLIVDDEEAIRKLARRTLERSGYRVLVAAHGVEAVSLYTANAGAIAAVVLDMSMPIMDGPATVAALKAFDPAVRIIGSTGLDTDGKAAKARSLGVSHWVPKPYTSGALLETLRAVIESTRSRSG